MSVLQVLESIIRVHIQDDSGVNMGTRTTLTQNPPTSFPLKGPRFQRHKNRGFNQRAQRQPHHPPARIIAPPGSSSHCNHKVSPSIHPPSLVSIHSSSPSLRLSNSHHQPRQLYVQTHIPRYRSDRYRVRAELRINKLTKSDFWSRLSFSQFQQSIGNLTVSSPANATEHLSRHTYDRARPRTTETEYRRTKQTNTIQTQ